MTKQKLTLPKMMLLEVNINQKSVNTLIGGIANLNWSVDLFIQKISAEPILRAKLAMKIYARADIQKSANGGNRSRGVKDKTVIIFMKLLFVMMCK